ncbi:insoluble domain protein [Rhodococcus triatomae]
MGKHRKISRASKAGIVPVTAAAIAVAGTGVANASPIELPSQGGVTSPAESTQGGTTTTPSVPQAPSEPIYWVEPPAYQPEWQPLPNYDYETGEATGNSGYIAPIDYSTLHAPTYVEPAPMYIAPAQKLMIGDYHFNQPNWMTDEDLERTNNTSELIRSQTSTFWRSVGVDAARADRIAVAQMGGAVVGATAAGALGAIPGALLGGNIGGNAGLAVGGVISVPLPPPLPVGVVVPTTVVGTAAGAVIGGAITGIPSAVAGAGVGYLAGTAFGAGDNEGDPIEVEVAGIDQAAITTQTESTLSQWDNAGPVGQAVATAVRDTVAAAPGLDQQARDWAAMQPGGEQAVAAIDGALNAFFGGSAGVASQMVSTAVGDGVQQA